MSWPQPFDYQDALTFPERTLRDPELAACQILERTPFDAPLPISGAFATVYRLRHPDGRSFSVRLFRRDLPGRAERLMALSEHLARLTDLPEFLVPFEYQSEGILVKGRLFPVMKMPWIEGVSLGEHIESSLGEPLTLVHLASLWRTLALLLEGSGLVHGDLQRSNILVERATGALKLIDYDGAWSPALNRLPADRRGGEGGHPAYQHPRRAGAGAGPGGDRFSALLIYVALRALAVAPELWYRLDHGDNLLFRPEDLRTPTTSRAFALIRAALKGRDEVLALLSALSDACLRPEALTPPLARFSAPGSP